MADFIYLLQNRLTPAQWRALETVREAARAHSMPVFLVGGAVRDLSTGSPVRDLDFAVQGDVAALIPDLERAGATITGKNALMSSLYLTFRGGVRGELGSSLTVSYPKPGQPETQPAPILDDLRRRDFTANAMAVSLNEGSYGLLLDPLNGTADIENRELRLVSAYGFIEQPALLLRAARLGERLGWSLEERTAGRYQTGKEEGYIQALPAADRGYELEEIFHEEDPPSILEHMEAEGWSEVLFPALRSAEGDRAGLDHVRELIGQLEGQGIHPDPSSVYFPLITAKLGEGERAGLKALFVRPGFVQQIETVEARAKELGAQLTSKAAALPSESWRLLMNADPELVLWLAVHTRTGAVQTKIKAFLKDWPQMRQKIPYALMQEMRITPDLPEYEKLLDDLFFALIDGKLDTPEATRAFLEPFSPPAPPQVTVRRRPAKSARSRSKKGAADVAPEPVVDPEDREPDNEDEDVEATDDSSEEADVVPEPIHRDLSPAKSPVDSSEPAQAADVAPSKAAAAPKTVAPKKAPAKSGSLVQPQAETPAKTAPVPAKAAESKAAPAVKPAPAKAEPQSRPGAHPKDAHPAAPTPAKKSAPLKLAAKASAKVAAKSVAKPVAKAVSKGTPPAPKKTVAKQPAKKIAAKVVARKTTPVKAPAKTPAKKVAAKKQPAKSGAVVAAKRGTPVKAAKKIAAKGRNGR